MWADSLKREEVEGTLAAARRLQAVPWAAPLLARTRAILARLQAGVADREAYRADPLQPDEMPFLFEIRFADALAAAGVAALYEHAAGVGNSTVDFRVDLDPPWLVELVSLRESSAFKAAAWQDGVWQGFILRSDADDPRQSEEGETLNAQTRIGEKLFDRKRGPIKFPVPAGAIHMLMIDARGFLGGGGGGDPADWHQIAYGPHGLAQHLVKCWTNPATGKRAPIKGLFEPGCPLSAAATIQARLHILAFVCEKNFTPGELKNCAFYCCNPALFPNEEAARTGMASWPLRRTAFFSN